MYEKLTALDIKVEVLRAGVIQDYKRSTSFTIPAPLSNLRTVLVDRSALADQLDQLSESAARNGVRVEQGRFVLSKNKVGPFIRYEASFPVRGDFVAIRRFLTEAMATFPNLALTGLTLDRQSVGDAELNADIEFALYAREG